MSIAITVVAGVAIGLVFGLIFGPRADKKLTDALEVVSNDVHSLHAKVDAVQSRLRADAKSAVARVKKTL